MTSTRRGCNAIVSALAGVVLLVGLDSSGAATGGDDALPLFQTRPEQLTPGTWVQLEVDRGRGPAMTVKIAALEKIGKAQWFEFVYRDPSRPKMIFKVLAEGALADPGQAKQALFQLGTQPPIALPSKLVSKQVPAFSSGTSRKDVKVQGSGLRKERVKVAAGTFSAVHYRRKLERGGFEEFWVSTEVPGWPMIKLKRPGLSLQLLGYGRDAKSELRGKPIELDPSLFEHLDALK